MQEKPDTKVTDEATDEEKALARTIVAAFSGPAVFCNQFYLTTGNEGVRIGFIEQATVDHAPIYRTAVMITPQLALELVEVLQKLITPVTETAKSEEVSNG